MRISSKGRLALLALCELSLSDEGKLITLSTLSKKLACSKLYLEQVFAVLRRAELVLASKGAGGGYVLAKDAGSITAYEILAPIELSLFAPTEETSKEAVPHIETTLQNFVFTPLDRAVVESLQSVTLAELAEQARVAEGDMYYI